MTVKLSPCRKPTGNAVRLGYTRPIGSSKKILSLLLDFVCVSIINLILGLGRFHYYVYIYN